jgi:predicted nuclease of predicted toxin-antitoxin system
VKFIFDANLSPKLARRLVDLFPGSVHLFDLSYPRDVEDVVIWTHARDEGFGIVTADGDDFPRLVRLFGFPPRVLLLASWQYPTRIAEDLIRSNAIRITRFLNSDIGLLVLRR